MNSDTLATSPNLEPTPSQSPWKKIISFPALLAVLLAGGMFVPLRDFWVDPDVWWHIKVGATILSTHHWPTTDPYSFTAYGTPWIAYQWLGEVVMAIFANRWGLRGLMALDVILGRCHPVRPLRAGHPALREFQSGFCCLHSLSAAGLRFAELASPDARLSVAGAHPHHS